MPLFFFDTDDGERRYQDRRGLHLSSGAVARREAAKLVRDLAYAGLMSGGRPRVITATLRDATGTEIYRVAATLRLRQTSPEPLVACRAGGGASDDPQTPAP